MKEMCKYRIRYREPSGTVWNRLEPSRSVPERPGIHSRRKISVLVFANSNKNICAICPARQGNTVENLLKTC